MRWQFSHESWQDSHGRRRDIRPMKNALLLIDPYNDFLAEEGKIWPHVAAVAQRLGTLDNLRRLVAHARASAIPILYVPHRQSTEGDYEGWSYLTPTQAGVQRLK